MGKLATTDTILSIFQPRLSCYGICILNTPPNGRYRQLSAGHPPDCTARQSGDFCLLCSSYGVVFHRQNLITAVEGHYPFFEALSPIELDGYTQALATQ